MTAPAAPNPPQNPPAGPTQPTQPAKPPPEHLSMQHPFKTASLAGFAKMLGPSATPEQVQKAMMQCINFIIADMKREAQKAHEAAQKMKRVIEDKDDD